jgi:amino acid transporter
MKFFTLKFWLQSNPELTSAYVNLLLILALTFIIILVYAYTKQKEKNIFRVYWRGLVTFAVWNFTVFTLWWFFSLEQIPVLSARAWIIIFLLVDLVWLYRLRKKFKKQAAIKADLAQRQVNKKYIP